MSDATYDLMIKAVGLSKEYDLKSHKVLGTEGRELRGQAR